MWRHIGSRRDSYRANGEARCDYDSPVKKQGKTHRMLEKEIDGWIVDFDQYGESWEDGDFHLVGAPCSYTTETEMEIAKQIGARSADREGLLKAVTKDWRGLVEEAMFPVARGTINFVAFVTEPMVTQSREAPEAFRVWVNDLLNGEANTETFRDLLHSMWRELQK